MLNITHLPHVFAAKDFAFEDPFYIKNIKQIVQQLYMPKNGNVYRIRSSKNTLF